MVLSWLAGEVPCVSLWPRVSPLLLLLLPLPLLTWTQFRPVHTGGTQQPRLLRPAYLSLAARPTAWLRCFLLCLWAWPVYARLPPCSSNAHIHGSTPQWTLLMNINSKITLLWISRWLQQGINPNAESFLK